MNRRRYAAAFQNPTDVYVDEEVMEFCDTVMEKSWNFVATISWQPCKRDHLLWPSQSLTVYVHI